jgi:hypothetical protein
MRQPRPRARGPLLLLPVLAATAAGCGGGDDADGADWQEPGAYTYTLDSLCGERSLLGTFRITVANGRVVSAEPAHDQAPTIGALLAEARAAREEEDADVVEVEYADDGRPTRIGIDYDVQALDDEACYHIADYVPTG